MIKKVVSFIFLIVLATSLFASALTTPSWHFSQGTLGAVRTTLYKIASYGTTPLTKSHETFRKIHFFPQDASLNWIKLIEEGRKAFFWTLPSAALRSLAANLHPSPYVHLRQKLGLEKRLPADRSFTLLSWNVCFVAGGYVLSDGGVLPWKERIDRVIEKIGDIDADVVSLYEVFDTNAAFILEEKLREKGYVHIYFSIGAKGFGPSSGIFVASKYAIENPEFIPFSQESLVGRTKLATKGVFAFDLVSEAKSFTRIYATHLQHSEEPEFPTEEEVKARSMQMQMILEQMQKRSDTHAILTGDLNLDDAEFESSAWQKLVDRQLRDFQGEMTWGGDQYSAKLMEKRPSAALNLDHTLVLKEAPLAIETTLVPTGFDGAEFRQEALSDHAGLLTKIKIISAS